MPMSFVRALVPVSLLAISSSLNTPPRHAALAVSATTEITGNVTDANTSQPLPNTWVSVRDTALGTTADAQGHYRLVVPIDSAKGRDVVLLVRRIGYGAGRCLAGCLRPRDSPDG